MMKLCELLDLISPDRNTDEQIAIIEDNEISLRGSVSSKYWSFLAELEVENIGAETKDVIAVYLKE